MPKLIPDQPESLKASVAPAAPPVGRLRTAVGLLVKGVLGFVILVFAVGSGLILLAKFGYLKPTVSEQKVATAPVEAPPVSPDKGARLQCMAFAQDSLSGIDWKSFKRVESEPHETGILVSIEGRIGERPYVLSCLVDQGELTHTLYRFDLKSKEATEEVNLPPPCPQGFTAESICKSGEALAVSVPATPAVEPEPEVLSPEAREQRARGVCVGKTLENFKGVDWKFFNDMKVKPSADHMTVTIEGKRESQAYRMVCQMPDGSGPAALTLYRVDSKSKVASVETKTLEPCTSGWTDESVCRPARPKSDVAADKRAAEKAKAMVSQRAAEAYNQCRHIALSEYPAVDWRWIRGVNTEWFELRGVHGIRTSIDGTRNGRGVIIRCFLPDGAAKSVHELSAL